MIHQTWPMVTMYEACVRVIFLVPTHTWFEDQEVCKYNSTASFFRNAQWLRDFYEGLN